MNFKKLDINDFVCNPFSKIGKDWMTISSGNVENSNSMTASLGGLGVMWGKDVTFTFIRPQRYTKKLIDTNDKFSLCFFDEKYKKSLSYLGTVSRNDNSGKMNNCDLTTCFIDDVPCFEEAGLILICKKLYVQKMEPTCFIDTTLDNKWYENKDYHFMYVSSIENIFSKL